MQRAGGGHSESSIAAGGLGSGETREQPVAEDHARHARAGSVTHLATAKEALARKTYVVDTALIFSAVLNAEELVESEWVDGDTVVVGASRCGVDVERRGSRLRRALDCLELLPRALLLQAAERVQLYLLVRVQALHALPMLNEAHVGILTGHDIAITVRGGRGVHGAAVKVLRRQLGADPRESDCDDGESTARCICGGESRCAHEVKGRSRGFAWRSTRQMLEVGAASRDPRDLSAELRQRQKDDFANFLLAPVTAGWLALRARGNLVTPV